ncbi:unnamed protein product [Rotaria sp. Silwood2]|nr:unnamed protein product [Rotaria sp. Silwood2]CAF2886203.1 unnamed protein product [Rotaria sp. Silwood2]CAF3145947.1 unnamed protein product [Rotaria sp. Silwood2]CAF3317213.1 unnamed protein product [Rotaria sp. Silwood2]CAF4091293.1 unnamed protein product [Rotaria sp. Silwood2]
MSSYADAVNKVNIATTTVVLSLAVVNLVTGAIGLVLNALVFTRPALRGQPCSLYFLSSTYANMFVVFVIIPVRIVSGAFKFDPANLHFTICMLLFFVVCLLWKARTCLSANKFDLNSWLKQVNLFEGKETERNSGGLSTYLELPTVEPHDNQVATVSWIIDAC